MVKESKPPIKLPRHCKESPTTIPRCGSPLVSQRQLMVNTSKFLPKKNQQVEYANVLVSSLSIVQLVT